MTRRYVATSLGRIHLREEGSGEPILLLHRTPNSSRLWDDVLPILARQARAIALDTPGFGLSQSPPTAPGIAGYARAVLDVMDELEIPQASLMGHRTGSSIAMEVASHWPDRVTRLVLSGAAVFDPADQARGPEERPRRPLAEDGSHLLHTWALNAASMPWATPSQVGRCVLEGTQNAPGAVAAAEAAVYEQVLLARLGESSIPTLVLYGETDPFAERALRACADMAHVRAHVFAGGHQLTMLESPTAFCATVAAFLADGPT